MVSFPFIDICPKNIGWNKHNKKVIFDTFELNSSLEIFDIPNTTLNEKDKFTKWSISYLDCIEKILIIKAEKAKVRPG